MIPSALAPTAIAVEMKPKMAQLRKATDQLQAMFVETLVKEMRSTSKDEFSDMAGSDVYDGMVNEALADSLSKHGNFGISDLIFNQLSKVAIAQAVAKALRQNKPNGQRSVAQPQEK